MEERSVCGVVVPSSDDNVEEVEFKIENCRTHDYFGFRLCGSRSAGVFIKYIQSEIFLDQVCTLYTKILYT